VERTEPDSQDMPDPQDMLDLAIDNNNQIFQHRTLRINYTSYDLQRHSDLINIRTRPDLMILSEEGDKTHPYQYGQLIDIFIPAPDKGGSDSGTGSDSDDPPESEKGISGDEILEDEETLEGGFGYSVF
jgi:hypothetical protein